MVPVRGIGSGNVPECSGVSLGGEDYGGWGVTLGWFGG